MAITQDIFVAYSRCPRKAFLLLFHKEASHEHEYEKINKMNRVVNQNEFMAKNFHMHGPVRSADVSCLRQSKAVIISALLRSDGLAADCALLTRVRRKSLL
jgi:hypothetical protein